MSLMLFEDYFLPQVLFRMGEQGFWYDPPDFSTLYQDASGTTPVTAPGQSVGLMLDKRLGLVLGSELVTNGDFSSGSSGWSVPAGWSISGGAATASVASSSLIQTAAPCAAGRAYIVEFDYTHVSGTLYCRVGAGSSTTFTTSGRKRFVSFASNIAGVEFFGGAVTGSVDNISVRELPGNHAYQTTAPSRPTVQSGYNTFDKTDDHLLVAAGGAGTTGFLLACGVVVPAAGTARTIFSDRGTNAGYKLSIDAANKITFSGGTGAAFTTLTSTNALTAGQKYAVIAWHDGTNLNLSINNVPETPVACGTVTAGTATFTIGKDNGAASGYWGDRIYTAVYRRNDSSSAAQRSGLYSYIVGKMGGL